MAANAVQVVRVHFETSTGPVGGMVYPTNSRDRSIWSGQDEWFAVDSASVQKGQVPHRRAEGRALARAKLTRMPRDTHFEHFENHTLLKHFLLETYLKAWGSILLEGRGRTGGRFSRAIYVDAFAGAGCDDEGRPGSPLRAAQIATEINAQTFPGRAGTNCGMQVIAIEHDHEYYDRLVSCLAQYTGGPDSVVYVHHGELDSMLLAGIGHFAHGDPTFHFLDPFGIDGLDAALLPQLLAHKHSEVLMLFSDEGAVRLHGKGAAVLRDPTEGIRAAEAALSLFGVEHEMENVAQARRSAARVIAGHKSNPRAKEIMLKAFGSAEHVAMIEQTPIGRRQQKAIDLYTDLLIVSGAKRVLRFAMATGGGRHKYTLLHASKQTRAFAAMKDAIHRAKKKQDTSAELLTDTPLKPIIARIRERFAGTIVRWQGETPSVQQFAIDETNLMYHECGALKAELESFVIAKKPLTYQF